MRILVTKQGNIIIQDLESLPQALNTIPNFSNNLYRGNSTNHIKKSKNYFNNISSPFCIAENKSLSVCSRL